MEITVEPNKILKQKLTPVKEITPEITALISNMHEQMIESKGIGLAANQIGIDLQIFVIDKEIAKENNVPNAYLNPEITEYSEEESEMEEGCLSIPEYFVNISRPKKIKIKAIDENGNKVKFRTRGLLARVLQHEYDHLNGKLIRDRARGDVEVKKARSKQYGE